MLLEVRSRSCFSNHLVIKADGRPIGDLRGRVFAETVDVQLVGGGKLRFEAISFWSGEHALVEASTGRRLAHAQRQSFFRSAWEVSLSPCTGMLVSAGLFNTAFRFLCGEKELARVDRIGLCESGFRVEAREPLAERDALFIGLVYRMIVRKRAAAAAAG